MTAQLQDICVFRGERFVLHHARGRSLFVPELHGLRPKSPGSFCWSGWTASYAVTERLLLTGARVWSSKIPVIYGVEPEVHQTKAPNGAGKPCLIYTFPEIPLAFTGTLELVKVLQSGDRYARLVPTYRLHLAEGVLGDVESLETEKPSAQGA
ncbi:hypothetical protein [Armatimonas rosea]|uniref:Uncharacterized protein n=1 Tax=Armatimonas rosea TaxID=685828 RepID=A0A7W9SP94_ARMRO|nr:hypothetical protein [Armatimonas rosea]MBB6050322.1 hypothetical protein [Armatimonas rosea]